MSDKTKTLVRKLQDGWITVSDIGEETGWKPHTIRAFISTQAKKLNLKAERARDNGITSYRLAAP